jgi:hypothetical protein
MAENKKEGELSEERLKGLLKVIHPSTGQDLNCPHIKWMGYDLGQCPGVGEWYCLLDKREIPGEYGGPSETEYRECNNADHNDCELRINYLKKVNG